MTTSPASDEDRPLLSLERRIAVGSDHAGYRLKGRLAEWLRQRGWQVCDVGTHQERSCDYPDYAQRVARALLAGEAERGLLVCGTGVGMAIAANRFSGVRAVVCTEPLSAKMARAHNDANVLCLGARLLGEAMAIAILEAFLQTAFEGGRHQRRVAKLEALAEAVERERGAMQR